VWSVTHRGLPIVSTSLLVRRGAADDPPDRAGLAAMTLDMLDEGSRGRGALQLHEALAAIGAHLESDINSDAMMIGATVLRRFVDRAFNLLADILVRPSLAEADFDRVRQLRLHRLGQLRDLPGAVADRAFTALLYGSHPYGHTPLGHEQSLQAMSVDDVRRFHGQIIGPAETVVLAVGDCRHDEVTRLAGAAFEGWSGAAAAQTGFDAALPDPARLVVVSRPGAPQSELRIGHVAVARDTPDYHALVAANQVLGGQFVSRMNLNLREDKGFTYGARTTFDFRRRPGPFALHVAVDTAATARAIEEALGEISAIRGARPVTADELQLGIAGLTRGYARNFETVDQIARAMSQLVLYDLPDDYFSTFVPTIERVTPAEVTGAASRHLRPEDLTTLVVGDLDVIGGDLARLGLGAPVVLSVADI
jgi:predicted Zn-dependent peptidase